MMIGGSEPVHAWGTPAAGDEAACAPAELLPCPAAGAEAEADAAPGAADPLAVAAGAPAPGRAAAPEDAAALGPATLVGADDPAPTAGATDPVPDGASGEPVSVTPGSAAAGVDSLAALKRAARSLFEVLVPQPLASSVAARASGRKARRRTRI
jgi:hypothetical protein